MYNSKAKPYFDKKSENKKQPNKPWVISPDFANIPAALQALPQWICWKWIRDDHKQEWAKVPISARTLRATGSTDKSGWTSFDTVRQTYQANNLDGIGFCTVESSDLLCIDFDECRFTDGSEDPAMREWAASFDSYTEISPTLQGYHVWCRVAPELVAKYGTKRGKFEAYNHDHYLCFTGHGSGEIKRADAAFEKFATACLGVRADKPVKPATTSKTTQDKPEPVKGMDAGEFRFRLRKALEDGKFSALYLNPPEDGLHSESVAAFLCKVAFYFGSDFETADNLFRQSALWCDKWSGGKWDRLGESEWDNAVNRRTAEYTLPNDWRKQLAALEKLVETVDFSDHVSTDKPATTQDKTDRLLEEIKSRCVLWHDKTKTPYATLPSGAHVLVQGSAFSGWIVSVNLELTGRGLSKAKIEEVVGTCSAIAIHYGEQHKEERRVARLDSRIEIDLGDSTHEAVIITPTGWTIDKPSARFVRSNNAAAFPRPVRGGSIEVLRPFVNLSPRCFPLFVGSILDALKGRGEYLITSFTGEQGTSKSTLLRIMRRLIDPVERAELSGCPRNEQDLAIDSENNLFLPFDNISRIPQWLSDAFCCVSTGGGFKTRKLYTNNEQSILDVCCPLALNGIEDFVVSGDLIDRTVSVQAEVISGSRRLDSDELWAEFEKVRPVILGVIFDALSAGLRNLDTVSVPLPRMAKSAKWIAACLPAFGWAYADWFDPYQENMQDAVQSSLDTNSAAPVLVKWFEERQSKEWNGTPQQLYDCLYNTVSLLFPADKVKYFPTNPKNLSDKLTRAAPALRRRGIELTKSKKAVDGKSVRLTTVRRIPVGDFSDSGSDGTQDGTHGTQTDFLRPEKTAKNAPKMSVGTHGTHGTHDFQILEKREKEDKEDMETTNNQENVNNRIPASRASRASRSCETPINIDSNRADFGTQRNFVRPVLRPVRPEVPKVDTGHPQPVLHPSNEPGQPRQPDEPESPLSDNDFLASLKAIGARVELSHPSPESTPQSTRIAWLMDHPREQRELSERAWTDWRQRKRTGTRRKAT